MASTVTNTVVLGGSQTGLTLTAALVDTAGAPAAGMVTLGIVELGVGNYLATHEIPDGHRGAILYSSGATLMAVADVNPESAGGPLTAAEVWTYSPRTVTSYGTLVADMATAVWASASRTLTDFGTMAATIAAAVWTEPSRTLTAFGNLVSDVATAVWSGVSRTLTGFSTLVADIAAALSSAHGAGLWTDAGGAGGGANTVTLTIVDDVAAPVMGASLTIKNTGETAIIAGPQSTNGDGDAIFNLDNGGYHVIVRSTPAYQTLAAQTLAVSGTTTDTYTLTRVSTTVPTAPNSCICYADLVDISGNPAVGVSVVFTLPSTSGAETGTQPAAGQLITVAKTKTVTSDSAGRVQVQLVWSSVIAQYAPSDETEYTVSCADAKLTASFSVPDAANLNISSLFPPLS